VRARTELAGSDFHTVNLLWFTCAIGFKAYRASGAGAIIIFCFLPRWTRMASLWANFCFVFEWAFRYVHGVMAINGGEQFFELAVFCIVICIVNIQY